MNNKKQRNRLFTMLLLVMAILMPYGGAWAQETSQPLVGNGSKGNPYEISTAAELAWFRDYVNGGKLSVCAKLTADIDLKDFCHAADASKNLGELSWEPIGVGNAYSGTFDGSGKTISNLYIKAEKREAGLFGYTFQSTIKNLTFENANVTNTELYTGILVGDASYQTTLQNIKISTKCQIIGGKDYTGGIAGSLDGNAYNCVNYAMVQGQEDVGGLFGLYNRTGNSMTACANYGNVTATSNTVGGLVGYYSSGTIQDCANYGNIEGTYNVGGMAGYVSKGKMQNVFCYGNVSATDNTIRGGMVCGYSSKGVTEGMVAYYSGAKLTVNSQEQTVKAFGSGNLSEDNATGFTETQLKSGVVAYLLQQNASSEAKWGQNLANNGDSYPVIGSEHQVYADNLTLNCKTNEMVTGSFTNNPTSSAISYQHGQTINHHVAKDATCTEAGTKEYWQCQDCLRTYSDSELTKELTDVTNADQPALGHHGNEDGYCDRCQHYVAVKPSEDNGVYLIAKPCHLAWFRDYVNGTIVDEGETAGTTRLSASAKLTADIDLKNYCHAAEDGKELLSWIPIGNDNYRWEGKMDGQGHTISNLYIKTAQNYVGLFGFTDGATIQDLIFDNAKVENVNTTGTNTSYTGILAGNAYGDSPAHIKGIKTTNNCTVIGQNDTGGIVGRAKINLENCENRSSVKGTGSVGGIAGDSFERNIKRCTNYGTVENDGSYIGGIIGYAYETSIEDCANYGKITSTGWFVGGIAGLANSSVQNVFSYGDVTNTNENDNPGIIIGYVDGTLTAKGIVAYNKEALLNNSSENIKVVGSGSLTFDDGKEEAVVVKAFTKQQIKSGEVAWLLNGSTSAPTEGSTLAWYQKLGENGDAYPVLTSTGENTVHSGYQHGSKESFFSNNNQHSVAYNAEAEDEVNGNHDLSYEAGEYTWTEAEDKTQVPSVAVTYTCKVCGKTETPQMTVAHDEEHDNVEATCTEDGHKYYKTSYAFNAKAIFSNAYTQTLPALGHNMSDAITFDESKSIYTKGCTRADCDYHDYYATSDGSIEAKPNDDASAFTVEAFTLNDATVYNSQAEFTVKELTYNRSFAHDKWQAVYVPFELKCDQIPADYEVATINNFHEFEQKDGSFNTVLEVKPVKNSITIPALTPCLIRLKQAPETAEAKTLQFTNVSFAAAADKKIDCASVTRYYQFLGTLNAKTGFDTTSDFVINEGELWKAGSDTELNPQRWYLNASDRTGSELNPSVQLSRIAIHVIGGDETTDIDGIYVKTDTEDVSSSRQGIYDLQGRKLSEEPTSGIYIKDGKKYVK